MDWLTNQVSGFGKGCSLLLLLLFAVLLMACSRAEPTAEIQESAPYIETGKASHYSQDLDGAKTTSGEIYRNDKSTAAHRTLEFGTEVKVTNLENGKSTIVVINDRGPFAAGLIIDVSYSAAQELDMIESGVVRARIEALE
jgi:rare lipoprotein A